eukprot:9295587-Lingulodinium_polyedra.AAC.1
MANANGRGKTPWRLKACAERVGPRNRGRGRPIRRATRLPTTGRGHRTSGPCGTPRAGLQNLAKQRPRG